MIIHNKHGVNCSPTKHGRKSIVSWIQINNIRHLTKIFDMDTNIITLSLNHKKGEVTIQLDFSSIQRDKVPFRTNIAYHLKQLRKLTKVQ